MFFFWELFCSNITKDNRKFDKAPIINILIMILQLNNQNKMSLYNIHVQLRIIQEWISANINSLKGFSLHT